jgi:hypothetical protein
MFTKKGSTKDEIIGILTYNWPLSIRKIYFCLKKQGLKVGYQAVYKAVKEMLDEGILIRENDGYLLNMGWIKDIHNQTEMIRVNYFSKERSLLFHDEKKGSSAVQVFIFNNWFDFEKYAYYLQKDLILKSKEKQIICAHHYHEWRPMFYLRAEYNWVRNLIDKGHRVYTLCSGESVLDIWAAKFYNSIGGKVKIGQRVAEPADVIVFGDMVIQAYIPSELKEALDRELRKIKRVEELDSDYLIKNVFEKESTIKVIINHDRNLAKQIRDQILKKFR